MIENSPFHISKTNVPNPKEPLISNASSKEQVNKNVSEDKSSFWDWFRGLVNPLQNLPIVSGIYSSMNSDDKESDRDLVQNSLGGFMYGGPIGAIAGFGNWVFNKLFDRTPTELALDLTGISNLWKDDKETTTAKEEHRENQSHFAKNNIDGWWNSNRQGFVSSSEKKHVHDKFKIVKNKDSIQGPNDSNVVSLISNKYRESEDIVNKQENISKKIPKQKIIELDSQKVNVRINKPQMIDKIEKSNNKVDQFREINFNYPEWNPNEYKIKEKTDKGNLQKKYLDTHNHMDQGSKINMKL